MLLAPAATPAFAAAPIGASPYVSDPYQRAGREQAAARLVVSQDGRTLVPRRGAFVSAYSPCPNGREGGANVALSSPARIRGDGSFHLVERQGETTLRLRGRFTRRWSARLVVRLRTPGFCRARPVVLKLRHVGDVPFRDCRTHPAETVARTSDSRVFLHRRGAGLFPLERAYGCLYSGDRRFSLGFTDRDGSAAPRLFRLAAPYAGFVQVTCSAACGATVVVRDLRDGETVRRPCCELITDLVLSPSGALAFIEDPPAGPPEVRAVSGASSTVLDSGVGIARTSLRLAGNTLSWRRDGVLRTAPLEQ